MKSSQKGAEDTSQPGKRPSTQNRTSSVHVRTTHIGLLQDILQLVGLCSSQCSTHVAQVDGVVHHPLAGLHHLQHRLSGRDRGTLSWGTRTMTAAGTSLLLALSLLVPSSTESQHCIWASPASGPVGPPCPRVMRVTPPALIEAPPAATW